MNQVLKNRLVGATVLIAVGILIPVGLVWWAQPNQSLGDGDVRVYEINDEGEAVPVEESKTDEGATAAEDTDQSTRDRGGESGARSREQTASRDRSPGTATSEQPPEPKQQRQPEPQSATGSESPDEAEQAAEPETRAPVEQASADYPESDEAPAQSQAEEPAPQAQPEAQAGTESRPEEGWIVQIGSFGNADNARAMKEKVSTDYPAFIDSGTVSGTRYHRVRVGPYASEANAEAAARRLGEAGYATQIQNTAADE